MNPDPYAMNPDPNDPRGYSPAPPYPSAYPYESERLNMPQPPVPPMPQGPPQMPPMPPNASPAPNLEPYPQPPRPQSTGNINEAVSSAVHSADSSSYLSPEVLSQITATVIQQLKATGLDNIQGSAPPPPPPPQSQSQPQQPPWFAAEELPRPNSESPPDASHREGSVPSPNPMANSYGSAQQYPPNSSYANDMRPSPRPSPDPASRRHDSMSSQSSQKTDTRPRVLERDATVMEMTTLEKIWGKLFEDDKPTKRLGQFLRGIAVHLVYISANIPVTWDRIAHSSNRLKITLPATRSSLFRLNCRNSTRILLYHPIHIRGTTYLMIAHPRFQGYSAKSKQSITLSSSMTSENDPIFPA